MDSTSGELGSGTGLGFVLRVKVIFEASSSARVEEGEVVPLLIPIEGAVLLIVCLMPESASSEIVRGSVAEGDMMKFYAVNSKSRRCTG